MGLLDREAAGAASAAFCNALPQRAGALSTSELLYALSVALVVYERERNESAVAVADL